jgi:phenylalanyl-tRNA synthetase beta subunit
MSVRGLARELAASLNCKYIDPANTVALKKLKAIKSSKAITVKIEAEKTKGKGIINTSKIHNPPSFNSVNPLKKMLAKSTIQHTEVCDSFH